MESNSKFWQPKLPLFNHKNNRFFTMYFFTDVLGTAATFKSSLTQAKTIRCDPLSELDFHI